MAILSKLPIMVNRATKIICETIVQDILEWNTTGDELDNYDASEMEDDCYNYVENNPELYDEDWFPIMSTDAIRKTVDWEYVANYHNDVRVDYKIEWLFNEFNNDC